MSLCGKVACSNANNERGVTLLPYDKQPCGLCRSTYITHIEYVRGGTVYRWLFVLNMCDEKNDEQ